jgi:hypothetical protein
VAAATKSRIERKLRQQQSFQREAQRRLAEYSEAAGGEAPSEEVGARVKARSAWADRGRSAAKTRRRARPAKAAKHEVATAVSHSPEKASPARPAAVRSSHSSPEGAIARAELALHRQSVMQPASMPADDYLTDAVTGWMDVGAASSSPREEDEDDSVPLPLSGPPAQTTAPSLEAARLRRRRTDEEEQELSRAISQTQAAVLAARSRLASLAVLPSHQH